MLFPWARITFRPPPVGWRSTRRLCVLLCSTFGPDPDRFAEWIACLWQGPAPGGVVVRSWHYLGTSPRKMLLIWEAADPDARAWMEDRLTPFGDLVTWEADDATPGMQAAIRRDIDGFGTWMADRGTPTSETARQVALRRAGMTARDWAEAAAAARTWTATE
jgi:hypothetical protein